MSHFAKVENGIVTQVIVADQNVIDSGIFGPGWIQTSYNTKNGVHYGQNGIPDGGTPLRGNYAGIGDTYDVTNDIFIVAQPFDSWTLDIPTATWRAPVAQPEDGRAYTWNEANLTWDAVPETLST